MLHENKVYCISERYDNGKSAENILSKSRQQVLEKSDSRKKFSLNYQPYRGLFYIILACVSIELTSVFVKKMPYISPAQLSLVRTIGSWVGSLPIAIYSDKEVLGAKKERPLLFARGLLGATAMYLNLATYRYLPIAEAAVILSATPAVSAIIARVYLKEPCGLVQGFALVMTLCGVLVSVKLSDILNNRNNDELDTNYIGGLASGVGCVLILSVCYVAMSKAKATHFSVSLLYTGFIGTVENGAICFATSYFTALRCGVDQILILLIGILGFIGQCALTRAIQVEAVGIVSVMRAAINIVLALVFQVIFFDANPDVYNIGGACLVILSVSVIGLKKWLITLPEETKARKRLKYLLI